jgi:hypothetical protein
VQRGLRGGTQGAHGDGGRSGGEVLEVHWGSLGRWRMR